MGLHHEASWDDGGRVEITRVDVLILAAAELALVVQRELVQDAETFLGPVRTICVIILLSIGCV